VVAAMVFNGHTLESVDAIDEETFTEIQVMYADGILGNRSVFDAVAPLTAAVFNYFRPPTSPAFRVDQIYPWIHEYSVDPDTQPTPAQQASDSLLVFMSQAQGFDAARFQHGDR
jgi:hypothetical protein